MPEGRPTQVFVPRIFDAPETQGVVVKAYKAEGEFVDADEPLIDLRSTDVDGEIVAPFAGTIVRLHAMDGDMVAAGALLADLRAHVPGPERAAPGQLRTRLGTYAPVMAALLCAAPAFVLPLAWLLSAFAVVLALAGAHDVAARRAGGRSATPLLLVPRLVARFVRWLGRSIIGVGPLLAGCGRLLAGAALAILLPAFAGGGVWLVEHGQVGMKAAARIAVADHGFRVFAFVVCLWLALRFWREPSRARSSARILRELPAAASLAACAAILAWTIACALVLPRSIWAPLSGFRQAVDLLPAGATEWVLRERAEWARSEAAAMSDCLQAGGRGKWREPTVTLRADGTTVVSLGGERGTRPGDRSVASLLLAAQNQLEPHPLTIVVHMGRGARLRFDTVPAPAPTTDIGELLARAETTDAAVKRLPGLQAVKPTDIEVALRCSAAGI